MKISVEKQSDGYYSYYRVSTQDGRLCKMLRFIKHPEIFQEKLEKIIGEIDSIQFNSNWERDRFIECIEEFFWKEKRCDD